MNRPLIGISACLDEGAIHRPGKVTLYLNQAYVAAVEAAAGTPVVIAFTDALHVVDRLDALVLSGGDDIHPRWYGEALVADANLESDRRVAFDQRLLQAAIGRGLPTLAVCYGLQLLNVLRGGTLVQTLPSTSLDHGAPGSGSTHPVEIAPGSRLAGVYPDRPRLLTRSSHRQAVGEPGRGLHVTAHADDGTIEALELAGAPVLGVQWHPETSPDGDRLYTALVTWAGGDRSI